MTKPVIDDIAHQVRTAHDFRQLGLVVISTELYRWLRFYPAKIRFCWGEKFVLTEVTTLDQFANRRWLNQVLIVMAQERRKRGTR
ncbi:Uncharacterised protein [Klebsiella pneumoniae]|nr:Uncharacterised protein [Klebsiella pneumoniae]